MEYQKIWGEPTCIATKRFSCYTKTVGRCTLSLTSTTLGSSRGLMQKPCATVFMPRDAELVDEYLSESDRLIQELASESPAAALPDVLYGNGEPGEFTVLCRVYDGIVHSIVFATGNEPSALLTSRVLLESVQRPNDQADEE